MQFGFRLIGTNPTHYIGLSLSSTFVDIIVVVDFYLVKKCLAPLCMCVPFFFLFSPFHFRSFDLLEIERERVKPQYVTSRTCIFLFTSNSIFYNIHTDGNLPFAVVYAVFRLQSYSISLCLIFIPPVNICLTHHGFCVVVVVVVHASVSLRLYSKISQQNKFDFNRVVCLCMHLPEIDSGVICCCRLSFCLSVISMYIISHNSPLSYSQVRAE